MSLKNSTGLPSCLALYQTATLKLEISSWHHTPYRTLNHQNTLICSQPVPDAIVSAMQYCPLRTCLYMQSCPGLCKNRLVDMWMTVHVCPRISERACTEPASTKGRLIYCKDVFARGGHNCICKCVRADTVALCSSVRADTIAYYAKPSGGHYCICNNVLRIVLHRGHNCMRHRTFSFVAPRIWNSIPD